MYSLILSKSDDFGKLADYDGRKSDFVACTRQEKDDSFVTLSFL